MAKLNEKQKIMAVCGVGALLSACAGFGIWWADGLVKEEEERIAGIKQEIQKAEKQIAKIPAVEADVITLRENVDEYVKILPDDDYISNFIRRTQEFLKHSGVRINSINPGSTSKRGKFDQYSYRIALEGTLWQFLKFVNQFENYERFVRVKEFSLQSGDGKKESMVGGDVRHKISMVVETYVYRGNAASKNVNIPNYSGKREKLRERILANALSIKLRRYDYKDAAGRRDIFIDPRQSATTASTGNPLDVQKARIEKYAAEVQAAREIFARIQDERLTYLERAKLEKSLRTRISEVNASIVEVAERELITWPPFRLKWNNEVVKPLEEIQGRIAKVRDLGDRWLRMDQLQDLFETLRADMADGRFEEVRERYASFQDKLGVDPEDERYAVVEKIEMLMLYVDAITDFAAIPLDIIGVVVHGDGRSGLLVNGQVMEEGEYVGEDLVLKRVESESAEFLFRGFTIVKSW